VQISPLRVILLPLILLGFGSSVGVMGSLFAVRQIAVK
jgi:cell division transport system permease protein